MKLFPRHIKILKALNGYSATSYYTQLSVRTAYEVIDDLVRWGYVKYATSRWWTGKFAPGFGGTVPSRTEKGNKFLDKHVGLIKEFDYKKTKKDITRGWNSLDHR